jgi:hypothetical protein
MPSVSALLVKRDRPEWGIFPGSYFRKPGSAPVAQSGLNPCEKTVLFKAVWMAERGKMLAGVLPGHAVPGVTGSRIF